MNNLAEIFKPDSKYKAFFLALLTTGLGYGIYKGVIDNYLAEVIQMTEFDRGVAEFFREIPGLMLIFVLAAFYRFSAEKFFQIGAAIMLIGMVMLSVVSPTKVLITIAICIYSLGEHIQLSMRSSLSLEYSKPEHSGQALGYQQALYQIGTLAGYGVVIIAFAFFLTGKPYRSFFLIAAVIMGLAMIMTFTLTGKSSSGKTAQRFYFRKKYTKYYILELFYGARKQVFFTFGPYVLILFYGANAMVISLLFAISAVSCFFLSPVVGKIIDKLGYKLVMISDTIILVVVCFFYGFAHKLFPMNVAFVICCINYILDSIISLASMAASVYVRELSDSNEETKLTLSTGVSVNHLITILIALFGGWIWSTLGMETLFILSAILGLCNSAYAATIKVPKKECPRKK